MARQAEAFLGEDSGGVAALLVATCIGLMALTAAAVGALRHHGLRHMHWRAVLRHHKVAQGWPAALEAVSERDVRAPATTRGAPIEILGIPRETPAPIARKDRAA